VQMSASAAATILQYRYGTGTFFVVLDKNLTSELTGRQRRARISASAAASGAVNIVFA
jgi:hypothetical protein